MAGSALSAGASIAGGMIGSSSAGKSAKAMAKAVAEASNTQEKAGTAAARQIAPWTNAGVGAVNQLSYLMGVNPTATSAVSLIPNNVYNALNAVRNKSPNQGDFDESGLIRHIKMYVDDPSLIKRMQESSQYQLDKSLTQQDFIDAYEAIKQVGGDASETAFQNVNKDMGAYGSLSKKFGMDDYVEDPGYQFRLQEGNKALERSQAAKGGLLSGAALKAAPAYNSGMASQEYQSAYDRYNTDQTNLFNRLSGIAGTGQTAATNQANINIGAGNNSANAITNAANAKAAGNVAGSNAWTTGLSSIGNTLQQAFSGNNLSGMFNLGHGGNGWNDPDSWWS